MKISKSYLQSKTLWVGLITILAPIVPTIHDLISANPEWAAIIVGGVFSLLRIKTDKAVSLKGDE